MKKVLIALDFDPCAQKVAEEGYALIKDFDAEVTLVHVKKSADYYRFSGHVTVIGFMGDLKQYAQSAEMLNPDVVSREFLIKAVQLLGDEKIKILVAEGECAQSLIDTAKIAESDMIIMGSHSKKWSSDTAMGRVTEKVLHYSTIPVLVIPTNKSYYRK